MLNQHQQVLQVSSWKTELSQYSDWIKSPKSARIWLLDSMTAVGQFAFINPLHRIKHWSSSKKRRVDCWEPKGKECFFCKRGMAQIHDYTYGVYSERGDETIYYLSVNLSTHSHFQRYFSGCFDNNINPCDLIHTFTRTKITTLSGLQMNGYDLKATEDKPFMTEVFRPSLQSPFQNKVRDFKWVVPEEIVLKLVDYDNKPMTSLIDFFLILKDLCPRISDKKLKSYAIRLLENNVVDLRKAKEYRN